MKIALFILMVLALIPLAIGGLFYVLSIIGVAVYALITLIGSFFKK